MVVYLQKIAVSKFVTGAVPDRIAINKPYFSVGCGQTNDVVIPCEGRRTGYFAIREEKGKYYLEPHDLPIFLNDYAIETIVGVANQDRIRVGDYYSFRFTTVKRLNAPSVERDKESGDGSCAQEISTISQECVSVDSPQTTETSEPKSKGDLKACQPPDAQPYKQEEVSSDNGMEITSIRGEKRVTIDPMETARIRVAQPSSALQETQIAKKLTPLGETQIAKKLTPLGETQTAKKLTPLGETQTAKKFTFTPIAGKPATPVVGNATPEQPDSSKQATPAERTERPDSSKQATPAERAEQFATLPKLVSPRDTVPFKETPIEAAKEIQQERESISQPVSPKDTAVFREEHAREKSQVDDKSSSMKETGTFQDSSILSLKEAEMTIMWDSEPKEESQLVSQIVSLSTGQILVLEKEKIFIGRSSSCDLCIHNDYVSRQHLELSRIPLGHLIKNIGKNDVIVEKKSSPAGKKITIEEKILRSGDSGILSQEATIILGNQVLYYFNNQETPKTEAEMKAETEKKTATENSSRNRKYNFYTTLARQKQELLTASQFQKVMTPPYTRFQDIRMGLWFRYFAISDLSGDFFLYHKQEQDIFLCLGDVSGHGPLAALFASQISGMFKVLAETQSNSNEIVQAINRHLFIAKSQTATIFKKHSLYALINVLKVGLHGIDMCIAGNSVPPLYYSAKEQKLSILDTPSTPTGLFNNQHFRTYSVALPFEEHDMLIMFTDGVTEAEMSDGTLVEYARAKKQIEKQIEDKTKSSEFLDQFLSWLTRNSEIQDDLSIVLIVNEKDTDERNQ